MASTQTKLITFAEFADLPDPAGGRYELYHGELIVVADPKFPHVRAQWQLRHLLEKAAGGAGVADKEFPYRPLSEYECWRADVAYIVRARWDSLGDYFMGAPEIVIEVLSPSNRASVLADKRDICLANGSVEFWIVDADLRKVEVFTRDGRFTTYRSGQEIPLFFAADARIAVDTIFA